jgi:beta-lactamase regulating signal transducer with metallopeptidase domain
MLLTWALFLLIVGRVLATATLRADRLAAAARIRRRFIWLAGLAMTAAWPAIAIALLNIGDAALSRGWGVGGVQEPRHLPMLSLSIPAGSVPARLELAFVALWALTSAMLLLRLALIAYLSWRWRESLPTVLVDGVRVRLSSNAGPAIGGLMAMDLILPAWAISLEPLERSMVLEHELSHRAARDIYLLWFAASLGALVPWNVFVWWQASHLRRAIEMDCDARVLTSFPHPVTYARMLVRIASAPSEQSWSRLTPALVGETTCLEQRIAAISSQEQISARTRSIHGAIVLGAVVLALALRPPMTVASPQADSRIRPRVHSGD